jgi:hypothetical protein
MSNSCSRVSFGIRLKHIARQKPDFTVFLALSCSCHSLSWRTPPITHLNENILPCQINNLNRNLEQEHRFHTLLLKTQFRTQTRSYSVTPNLSIAAKPHITRFTSILRIFTGSLSQHQDSSFQLLSSVMRIHSTHLP